MCKVLANENAATSAKPEQLLNDFSPDDTAQSIIAHYELVATAVEQWIRMYAHIAKDKADDDCDDFSELMGRKLGNLARLLSDDPPIVSLSDIGNARTEATAGTAVADKGNLDESNKPGQGAATAALKSVTNA